MCMSVCVCVYSAHIVVLLVLFAVFLTGMQIGHSRH